MHMHMHMHMHMCTCRSTWHPPVQLGTDQGSGLVKPGTIFVYFLIPIFDLKD